MRKGKKGGTIHASPSPVGYYHVLNCELQTQAVLKEEQKEKTDGSFLHPVKLFSWMRAYVPFSPAGIPHANYLFSVTLRKKFLIPIPQPIPKATIPRNESRESNHQNIFPRASPWGPIRHTCLETSCAYRTGVTRALLLLLLLFFRLWVCFQHTSLLMGGPLLLFYLTWAKECEICNYME